MADKEQHGGDLTDLFPSTESDTRLDAKPDISEKMLAKWQKIVNLLARIIGVPAGLIMRVHSDEIEVFVASETDDNPYVVGATEHLNTGLYCETVMAQRDHLLIPDALADPEWDDNPDIALDMISYLGFPLVWQDDTIFGTLCVLDNKKNAYSDEYIELVRQFSEIINDDLKLLTEAKLRQQAEDKLRQSEARYRSLFDSIRGPITVYDENATILMMKAADTPSVFDMPPEEFIGRPLRDFLPDMHDLTVERIREVLATQEPLFVEDEITGPHNSRWYLSVMQPTTMPGIDRDVVLTISYDITEQKQAEQSLRENERRLRWLIQHMPIMIDAFNAEGYLIVWNAECERVTGYRADEIIGNPHIVEIFYPDPVYRQQVMADFSRFGDDLKNQEYTLTCKDGSQRTIRWSHIPAPYSITGDTTWAVGIDVTEQHRAEEALRASEEKYRLLLENSHQGIIIEQANPARIVFASQSVQDILGYSPDEMLAMTTEELKAITHPDDWQVFYQHFQDCLQGKDVNSVRVRSYHASGALRHLDVHRTVINYDGKQATQATFVDVTERIEVERLKTRFQKEQVNNILIQRVISMLSHDLRTPLAIIESSRNLLSRYADRMSDEKRQEKLDTIGRQAQFALDILEDTVNVARGNLSDREFHPAPVNLAMLCQVSVQEIQSAHQNTHRIHFVNPDNIEIVPIDEVLVSRILLNLISNAIKYSPQGEDIRLELERRDEWIVLHVVDRGMGISQDDLPHIFDPFYRADAAQSVVGSGLGLSIVKDCVERHRGRIHVESVRCEGSTFSVELPVEIST